MELRSFLFVASILFVGTGCALKEIVNENPIRIEGRYEFVSMDFSIFEKLNIQPPIQPIPSGEAIFDRYRRFRAKYVDPILKREIINLDGEFIVRGNRIELNLHQARLNGNFRLSQKSGETRLVITWKIQGDDKLYNWILKKK